MIKIIAIANLVSLYFIVGLANGYNIAYRMIRGIKQSKKEVSLALITVFVSLPVFIISIISLLAFYRKREVERRSRKGALR